MVYINRHGIPYVKDWNEESEDAESQKS